ncbi:hypothetical protein B0H15DRAFT_417417 [Mycena belliarum]|uniref:Uncharacterized protein n=1 Tax=Mycena belliarum TaxID=1033014 RepID=A0AAD6U3Q5_9AGAR|nr:hypothetical protein B0H15DRAFT_417417 [Mycena belliae]
MSFSGLLCASIYVLLGLIGSIGTLLPKPRGTLTASIGDHSGSAPRLTLSCHCYLGLVLCIGSQKPCLFLPCHSHHLFPEPWAANQMCSSHLQVISQEYNRTNESRRIVTPPTWK